MSKAVRVILGVAFFVSTSFLFAAIHPVPLEKNADTATCVQCHEDKAKGKFVHSAIAAGCTACHEIRVTKDVTRIRLITPTPAALCITCHADMNAADLKGTIHPPAVRDCLKCHSPHQSDNKYQLLKPESGGKGENLCLQCHNQGLNVPEKGSRHLALDMGCDTCHVTHKVGEKGQQEFDYHLTKATPALCIDCHDVKSDDLIKAHHGQPFATANCVQCHNPHQSSQPKLMQTFTHPPFAGQQCDVCHQPAKDGKVVLTQPQVNDICIACHSDQSDKIKNAKVQHPGAQGDCTTCHNPHAGTSPGFLQPGPVSACLACHSDIADLLKKPVHHQPAFQQGCAICHEPHGGDNDKLLRVKGNALCLECHGNDTQPQILEAQHLITIFNGQVKLPADYFEKNKAVLLPLKYGLGHPVQNHPVSDLMDPANPGRVLKHLSCLTCHQPHSGGQPMMLVNDEPDNMAFCDTCHKNRMDMTKTGERQ